MHKKIYTICWVVALVLSTLGLNQFFLRPDSSNKYAYFYDDAFQYDVLFFGTSHVMDAVYPTELYRDYGIRSFNMGNPAETLEATYWTAKLALKRRTPKLAVIDVAYIGREHAMSRATWSLAHIFYDSVPFSLTKVQAVNELFPDQQGLEYLFPLISYHARWQTMLTGTDEPISTSQPFMFGAELRAGRDKPAEYTRTHAMNLLDTSGKKALRELISYLKSRNVTPILLAIPFPASQEDQETINSVSVIADEEQVPFLNLFDSDVVDFYTDCYDAMSHLNPDGASKVTRYIGEYLKAHYDLPDVRLDKNAVRWNNALIQYQREWDHTWASSSLIHQ